MTSLLRAGQGRRATGVARVIAKDGRSNGPITFLGYRAHRLLLIRRSFIFSASIIDELFRYAGVSAVRDENS